MLEAEALAYGAVRCHRLCCVGVVDCLIPAIGCVVVGSIRSLGVALSAVNIPTAPVVNTRLDADTIEIGLGEVACPDPLSFHTLAHQW